MPDDPTDAPKDDPKEDPKDDPKDEPFDEERAKAKIAKANSEAAGLRKRLKEAEEKAAKYDESEDAKKTESERLNAKVAEAERKAQEADARALRLEVAASKGLTPSQAKRLVGTTTEELEADADELLSSFKPSGDDKDTPRPSDRPRERLRGGGDPTEEPDETDPRKLAAQIPRT